MKLIAFYTENTPYEEEAKIWKDSFSSYSTKIYPIKNKGSWELNCAMKPKIILSALVDFDEPVLYLDIDARLCSPIPEVPEPELPGICFWNQLWNPSVRELLSGTIYMPPTENSLNLLNAWIAFQEKNPTMWDQKTFQRVIETDKYEYHVLPLDWINVSKFIKTENPIIYHTQASRRLKGSV